MNVKKQKAQTATEYLIILAVVIIIALIVVGVLGGFPNFGSSVESGTQSAYWQTQNVGFDMVLSATPGQSVITMTNNFPNQVTILNVSFDGQNILDTNQVILNAGQTATLNDANGNLDLSALEAAYCAAAGETFGIQIEVTYQGNLGVNQTFIPSQQFTGTCAN
ncbi:MAG: hypothetical protein ACMXYA_02940 [Candidatus Woesearchaeota archaeon]